MKETDLAARIIEHFSSPDHDIYAEVPGGRGIIDIVIKTGPVVLAIECKLNFSFDVIEQAFYNRQCANYSYVAVPYTKHNRSFQERICKDYGIGVLSYTVLRDQHNIREVVKPIFNRRVTALRLHEYMKRSVAGSQNERMTSFKFFIETLHKELKRNPKGRTHKELFEATYRQYAKPDYLKRNLITYIKSGVIKNVLYTNGKFYWSEDSV